MIENLRGSHRARSDDYSLFSFSDEGLWFHRLEPKFDDHPTVVRWMDLQHVLKPGWPQVLGVKPQSFLIERKAILDVVRAHEAKLKAEDEELKLLVQSLRVDGDWCYINVESGVRHLENGKGASYLLQNIDGKWRVRFEGKNHASIESDVNSRSDFDNVPGVLREAFIAHENTLESAQGGIE